jgi:hypothetical protein
LRIGLFPLIRGREHPRRIERSRGADFKTCRRIIMDHPIPPGVHFEVSCLSTGAPDAHLYCVKTLDGKLLSASASPQFRPFDPKIVRIAGPAKRGVGYFDLDGNFVLRQVDERNSLTAEK